MKRSASLSALVFVSVLLLSAPSMAQQAATAPAATAAPAPAPVKPFIYVPEKLDIVVGNAKAPVTIVEYASLSCPHCAHFYADILPDLKKQYIDNGKAKLVFRHYPLNASAMQGAKLVACVPKDDQEKFLKVLFATQAKWAADPNSLGALSNIAVVGGVDPMQFSKCETNADLEKQILESTLKAGAWVSSTPTFFVNGKKIEGAQPVETFAKEIDAATPKKK